MPQLFFNELPYETYEDLHNSLNIWHQLYLPMIKIKIQEARNEIKNKINQKNS